MSLHSQPVFMVGGGTRNAQLVLSNTSSSRVPSFEFSHPLHNPKGRDSRVRRVQGLVFREACKSKGIPGLGFRDPHIHIFSRCLAGYFDFVTDFATRLCYFFRHDAGDGLFTPSQPPPLQAWAHWLQLNLKFIEDALLVLRGGGSTLRNHPKPVS